MLLRSVIGAVAKPAPIVLFDPATLYASNEPGFVINCAEISSLDQDGVGTAVTSDGDPIGLFNDLSGSTNGADTAATGSARPTYKTDGTHHWALFDGIDDYAESATGIDWTTTKQATIIFAIKSLDTSGAENDWLNIKQGTGVWRNYAPRNSSIRVGTLITHDNIKGINASDAAYDPPFDMVVTSTLDFVNDEHKLWVNGTLIQTVTGLGTVTDLGTVVALFGVNSGTANVQLYRGLAIGRLLTTTERDDATVWAANGNGVTI